MVEGDISSSSTPAVLAPPPPRRPRVREVSSRFMSPSPVSTSSSCGDLHLLTAAVKSSPPYKQKQQTRNHHRRLHDKEIETSHVDENSHRPTEIVRSLETPFSLHPGFQRRHPRSLFNEIKSTTSGRYGRPETPNTVTTTTLSRSRVMQRSITNTDATKLLQSISSQEDDTLSTISDDSSHSVCEATTVPPRLLTDRNINSFPRSLNPTSTKVGEKPTSAAVSRSFTKIGGLSLPPVPPAKPATDGRKGKKVSGHQDNVLHLKLLYNRYLQWRFANAKAEESIQAKRRETERALYSLHVKISDLYDSVTRKRIELGLLRRTDTLSKILEAQRPYLEEWSDFEGDYSITLSEAAKALLNSSLQLPVGGNVRADVKEVREALNSAMKLMEAIISHVQSFMPKAEEIEFLLSELAMVTGGERALVEECGDLLYKMHNFQVEECSLRGQLMQLHQSLLPGQASQGVVHMR